MQYFNKTLERTQFQQADAQVMGHCSSAAMTLMLVVLILFYFVLLIHILAHFEKMPLQTQ